MSNRISAADVASRVASVVLHPLLLPVYCTLLVLYTPTPFAGMPVVLNAYLLGVVGIIGSLMPLIVIGGFIMFGYVSGVEMPTRSERVLPFMATALVLGCVTSLGQAYLPGQLPESLNAVLFGESVALFVAAVCSMRWKISLHAMGAGALLAAVASIGTAYGQDFTPIAAGAFVWAGIMVWARLHEKAHTPWQLLAGYVAGFAVMGLVMYLLFVRRHL